MMPDAELRLRLTLRDGRIAAVDVASTRFELPARLTAGRTADEVASTMPRLFSICAHAQGAAAAAALDAARGRVTDGDTQRRRDAGVRHEAIVELMTRLLLDWPRAMDAQPDVPAVARLRSAPADRCGEVAQRAIYGMEPARWLALPSLQHLADWSRHSATLPAVLFGRLAREAADLGAGAPRMLPATTDALLRDIAPRLREPGYARQPDWWSAPAETGALARHAGHPLLAAYVERHGATVAARMLARLVDLAVLLAGEGGALTRSLALQPGFGIGAAETARGLLVHCAQMDGDRVQSYRVLAPTEWNFHPQGSLAQGLLQRAAATPESARRDAAWLVQALDPCVACRIDVDIVQPAGEVVHA